MSQSFSLRYVGVCSCVCVIVTAASIERGSPGPMAERSVYEASEKPFRPCRWAGEDCQGEDTEGVDVVVLPLRPPVSKVQERKRIFACCACATLREEVAPESTASRSPLSSVANQDTPVVCEESVKLQVTRKHRKNGGELPREGRSGQVEA